MDSLDIAKQVLKRAFELLDHYGMGPDAFAEIGHETANLTQILLSAESTDQAKEAARQALKSLPIRLKQNAVAARVDMVERVTFIGETLVRVLLGLADLRFGG